MSWEKIIKRGKSHGRRKRIADHNRSILTMLRTLEDEAETLRIDLSIQGTSRMIETYGFENQMDTVKEMQRTLSKIEDTINDKKKELKELPADKIKESSNRTF